MPQTIELNFELHPKQLQAFQCPANEILFGGATRGGKSHYVRVALITFCEAVPGIQCLIIRKYYDDVISNHMEGATGFKAMLKPLIDAKKVRVTKDEVRWLHTGSLIKLSHCATEEAMQKNQGLGKDILVFEEACQIEERYIRFIRGWVTTTEDMKDKVPKELKGHLPKIYYTANPIGRSMGYFRRNFVLPATPGTIFKAPDDDGGFTRCYIEARVDDNPDEDPEATRRRIEGLGDAGMSQALLNADWNAPIGDYFPQYDDKKHTIQDFMMPEHWFKFLTFDWGSSEPFAVLWWAVVGEEGYEGSNRYLRPGTLICYREWFGCDKNDPSKGMQLRNEEIANGIIKRTREDTSGLVVTDSLPFQDRGMGQNGKKYTIADVFKEHGVPLVRGNTARIHGWSQVRDRLIGIDDDPLIVFMESCVFCRDYLPALPRHKTRPEDAEESGEATHICDAIRYACTTRPLVTKAAETTERYQKPDKISPTPKELLKQLKFKTE